MLPQPSSGAKFRAGSRLPQLFPGNNYSFPARRTTEEAQGKTCDPFGREVPLRKADPTDVVEQSLAAEEGGHKKATSLLQN